VPGIRCRIRLRCNPKVPGSNPGPATKSNQGVTGHRRPYFRNVGKRLVKTPRVYFADVDTLCYLAGLKDARHATSGPMGGAIFETAIVWEMARRLSGRGEQPQLYFWRTPAG